MKVPEVSLNAWRDLYDAALKYRDLKPWASLYDDQLFGVKDPATGQIGYCCVLGTLGEILALCVYRGSYGFDFYQRIQSAELTPMDDDIFTMQNALMAAFTDHGELEKEDLSIMKALKLKIRGRKQYPSFRSYLPGYSPWFLNEEEVSFLTLALTCACGFVEAYRREPCVLKSDKQDHYLVYIPQREGESLSWTTQWLQPEPLAEPIIPQVAFNELQVQKIKKMNLKSDTVWEADYFFFAGGIIKDRGRPYFARALMLAHHESGLILFLHLFPHEVEPHGKLLEAILSVIEEQGIVPSEVRFKKRIAYEVAKSLGEGLGFKITLSKSLSAIDEAKSELTRQARKDVPDFLK